jgi:2,3-bisphosphoglycerate-independent phosphoglycerate mutase
MVVPIVLVIIDGLGDVSYVIGEKVATPMQMAKMPALDALARIEFLD